MTEWATPTFFAALVAAYLAGSFPTALLVGKVNGIDLRTVGSGNLGATNVLRTLGWRWGLAVYFVDFLKGYLPTILLPRALGVAVGDWAWPWGIAVGVATILGHVKPIFLMGKGGGKGVSTASGVFMALAPSATLGALATFIAVVAVSRYVSLGALVGGVALTSILLWQTGGNLTPLVMAGGFVTLFVFYTHRENIRRLLRGEERRLGRSSPSNGAA